MVGCRKTKKTTKPCNLREDRPLGAPAANKCFHYWLICQIFSRLIVLYAKKKGNLRVLWWCRKVAVIGGSQCPGGTDMLAAPLVWKPFMSHFLCVYLTKNRNTEHELTKNMGYDYMLYPQTKCLCACSSNVAQHGFWIFLLSSLVN